MLRLRFIALFVFLGQIGVSQTKKVNLKIEGFPKQFKYTTQFPDSSSANKELKNQIDFLKLKGYFNIELTDYHFNNETLSAQIITGKLYKGIYLENGNIPPDLIYQLGLKEQLRKEKPLELKGFQRFYSDILAYYENNGYPFASLYLDSLQAINDNFKAKIFIQPNKNIFIDTLRLVGSVKVSNNFINSYLGLKNGQNYNEEKIRNIDKRLRDLSFVSVPKTAEVVFNGERASINLFLDKQNANQFDGIIGFLPNSQTGKLQITGDFKLNLKNALKSGETIDFNYRGLPSQSQELALKLAYPYIFKSQLGVSGDFQLFKRDSSFLNLNTKLGFDYNFTTTQKLSFYIENFNGNQVATDNASISTIPNFANIKSIFYGISGSYIKLDNKITPLKGYDLTLQAAAGSRKINPSENFKPEDFFESKSSQQFKLQADLKYYLKTGSRSVIYIHNYSAILTGKNLFENEAFRIGGAKTLRGFDEQSLNVNSFAIQTLEFRYLIEQNSYINIFYDQSYISQQFVNKNATDYPLGVGVGITFQTKVGIASLSYALGKQKNNPLDLQKGKIHFGIVSYF
ncbi:hypothetical protein A5893_06100 [Pedobacter psychrophilus]|uniref:Haemolysin activator HlyB C-terminal domain-containing protein n=1 Tax=Pedobacter psychrophilus TaxID=1826909 RepID=A0A179DHG7_9SPHI|nr:ShlB/FhaC/HecB family hemolysin secretion/activation protein [Pedobacter psychrophilus]OAQ40517.1 hypothetical protein A5893_06100 [Pedobacter psychrophilus]